MSDGYFKCDNCDKYFDEYDLVKLMHPENWSERCSMLQTKHFCSKTCLQVWLNK